MTDVQLMINYIVGKATPNANQIVAANINEDSSINMVDVQLAINTIVGKIDGKVVLRDSNASDASYDSASGTVTNYSNQFTLEGGTDLPLEAFYLGDIDGGYANVIT